MLERIPICQTDGVMSRNFYVLLIQSGVLLLRLKNKDARFTSCNNARQGEYAPNG